MGIFFHDTTEQKGPVSDTSQLPKFRGKKLNPMGKVVVRNK